MESSGGESLVARGDLASPEVESRFAELVPAAEVADVEAGLTPLRQSRAPERFELRITQVRSRHEGHSEGNAPS